jgi:hypothetical protein
MWPHNLFSKQKFTCLAQPGKIFVVDIFWFLNSGKIDAIGGVQASRLKSF